MPHILALDQGTTSSRAIVFDADFRPVASAQVEFAQHFPQPGRVEHDAGDLWRTTLECARQAIEKAGEIPAAIGITNQRETTVLWDRATGQPLHRAIVWQDRRTAEVCAGLRATGHEPLVTARTGLLLDPYFSGTKLGWLLDHIPGARARAEAGELAFGTVDSWLIWNLTGGRVHATDATNASRTLLFNIQTGAWDVELCSLLRVPPAVLPEVKDCAADYGRTAPGLFGAEIPILGVAGDQQAATIGQACFQPGMMKSTYGTGCFALMNTGAERVVSANRLLTTIAYRLGGKTTYALEGSIFVAGAVVQWLRDGLQIIGQAAETQGLAEAADPASSVVIVPAFTGMGAPYWRPEAQGAVFGVTRGTGRAELARAALESVGFQTLDLLKAMRADGAEIGRAVLRVDGGMARSDWTMQFLADILGAEVDRPVVTETTALGAAFLAALQAGIVASPEEFASRWALERRFTPAMAAGEREGRAARWGRAVQATLSV
ncbi:glycerol kinase GlpK [Tabrizicola oligotrophica]|uniref:Glycerol kinase n=1 Tax=Tabrizicola oligotrophica TaxID=2710650 RepID=A0A6M0QY87_9RHOB|nr:glycerol kinase GlpK [Tabrizicola oligotrophica]NEY91412.1 glycerol kinase GlpK [Tabrizicola oligotrophica]